MLYRQFFTAAECALLDATPSDSALSEISLLRILLVRLFEAARKPGGRNTPFSLKRHLSILAALGHAGLIMASLARYHAAQIRSGAYGDPILDALARMDPDDL